MSEYRIDPFSAEVDFSPASIWAHAKQDYLSGVPAQRVCDTYDLALSTFRTRAREEGWRRSDVAEAPMETPAHELAPAPPTAELIEQAWRAVADAVRRGRVYEARGWMKLVNELRQEQRREENIAADRAWQAAEAARQAGETAALEAASDPAMAAITDTDDLALQLLHSENEGAAADPGAPTPAATLETTEARLRQMIRRTEGLVAKGLATPKSLRDLEALHAFTQAQAAYQHGG